MGEMPNEQNLQDEIPRIRFRLINKLVISSSKQEVENLLQDSDSATGDKAPLEAVQERRKEGMPRNDITFITCCKGPTRVASSVLIEISRVQDLEKSGIPRWY